MITVWRWRHAWYSLSTFWWTHLSGTCLSLSLCSCLYCSTELLRQCASSNCSLDQSSLLDQYQWMSQLYASPVNHSYSELITLASRAPLWGYVRWHIDPSRAGCCPVYYCQSLRIINEWSKVTVGGIDLILIKRVTDYPWPNTVDFATGTLGGGRLHSSLLVDLLLGLAIAWWLKEVFPAPSDRVCEFFSRRSWAESGKPDGFYCST